MKSILTRNIHDIKRQSIYRGLKLMIRNRVRLVAIVLVTALLIASLPPGVSVTHGAGANRLFEDPQPSSLAVQVYRSVGDTITSFGNWLTSSLSRRSNSTGPLHSVAAYIPAPPFLDPPASLQVTDAASNHINLSWSAPAGTVAYYQVERSVSLGAPFQFVATVSTGTTFSDTTVANLHAYLYRVRAFAVGGLPSTPSNMALGTAIDFEFTELDNQLIRARHFHDVRTAVDLVRGAAGLPAQDWLRDDLTGLDIKATDLSEIRTALDAGLNALSIPLTPYLDPTLTPGVTTIQATHIEQVQQRSTRGSSTSAGPLDPDSSTARVDPLNETGGGGENPLSRNFNWNLPIVNLPGRAGMDLGLTLSYNSLVWTKIGATTINFDNDRGWPSAGFRLGFPVLQAPYFNSEVGQYAYLLIQSDGSRTELRQVPNTNYFDAGDSSYLRFDSSSMILSASDGTQLTYALMGNEYNCTKIKDRNGNYITVNYLPSGRIDTVIDTLGRSIKFNYTNGLLTEITQVWKQTSQTPVTHTWATFAYGDTVIQTQFLGFTVFGPANGTHLTTLASVTLADASHFDFTYTSWGQVWKVSQFAGGHLLNQRAYNLPGSDLMATGPQADCPRFTQRRDWAQYWNGDTNGTVDSAEEAVTQFAVPVGDNTWTFPGGSQQQTGVRAEVTMPDNTSNKIYYLGTAATPTGWQRSLAALVNSYDSGGALRRQSVTTWTQDNTGLAYKLNPRIIATKVLDPEGNQVRTEITYEQFDLGNGTNCNLQRDLYEYADATSSTKLRSTRTTYNMAAAYKNRRVLGLVSTVQMFEGEINTLLRSSVEFTYDEGTIDTTGTPIQHDTQNYPTTLLAPRGNRTGVIRYNLNNTQQSTKTNTRYNRAGLVVSEKDAAGHEVLFSYTDSFSDNTDRSTFAYATTVTDPEEFKTTAKYNYDFGSVTERRTPRPNNTDPNDQNVMGPIQYSSFDDIGRLVQMTNSVNSASVRMEYHPDQNRIDTFKTVELTQGEAQSFEIMDGHGRVVGRAKTHPSSAITGAWSGEQIFYDVMGRTFKTSNPTETSAASGAPSGWTAIGDDQTAGWKYSQQTYDWKSRPLVTTHQNGTTKTVTYTGCGCAGGEVATFTDEGNFDVSTGTFKKRQTKVYSDILGRPKKTEILNWENGTVYSTTVNTYNVRDQVTEVKEYVGAEGSGTVQTTTITYDGYGRMETKHIPQQSAGTSMTWTYNADDTVHSITDARNASQTFVYNDRHETTSITYAGVSPGTATASFAYDGAGNRTLMTDGLGSQTYLYDDLSRLTTETRTFAVGSFPINYSYNLAGQLSGVTDPFGQSFTYVRNSQGQLRTLTGSPYAGTTSYITDVTYRAWGAPKVVTYAGGTTGTTTYTSRMQPSTYRLGAGMREDYGYFADGRIASVTDLDDTPGTNPPATLRFLSRQYSYDHVGRVTGIVGTGSGSMTGVPLSQGYGYDVYGNMTSRSSVYYNYNFAQPAVDTSSYVNNRRTNWSHNAEGQITSTPSTSTDLPRTMTYDAAGRRVTSVETGNGNTTTYSASYDGDGKLAFESSNNSFNQFSSSYIVRSTVLGEVLTRMNGSGGKLTTHVPAEGLLFATQRSSGAPGAFVAFTWRNPLGISETSKAIYDPLGNYIPFRAAADPRPPAGSYNSGSMSGLAGNQTNPDSLAVGCLLDGIPTPCNKVMQAIDRLPIKELSIHGFTTEPWLLKLMAGLQLVETRRETTEERSLPPSETKYDDDGKPYDFIGLPPKTTTIITMQWVIAPGTQDGFEANKRRRPVKPKPPEPKKPTIDEIKEAVDTCIGLLWNQDGKLNVRLDSFDPTTSKTPGKASITITRPAEKDINVQSATITNSLAYTGAELYLLYVLNSPDETYYMGHSIGGLTFPQSRNYASDGNGGTKFFTPYVNYTASDDRGGVFTALNKAVSRFTATQIHELGNSIAAITGKYVGTSTNQWDSDSGHELEGCVNAKLVP